MVNRVVKLVVKSGGKTLIDTTIIDGGGGGTKRGRSHSCEPSNSKRRRRRLSFTCEICADEKPVSGAFRVLGCQHSYCASCVASYVAARLQQGAGVPAVYCPVPGCAGRLEPLHCRAILPPAVFDRWGDALCEALIPAAERLYCPYVDCSALLINDAAIHCRFACFFFFFFFLLLIIKLELIKLVDLLTMFNLICF